jgi:hypothetical protein
MPPILAASGPWPPVGARVPVENRTKVVISGNFGEVRIARRISNSNAAFFAEGQSTGVFNIRHLIMTSDFRCGRDLDVTRRQLQNQVRQAGLRTKDSQSVLSLHGRT